MLGWQKRREFLNDHLLANGAEWPVEITHPAIEFGPVHIAVIIIPAFEESDCSYRDGRRLRIAVGAVRIGGCRHRSGCLDQAAPLRGRAILIGSDVGLTGFASRVFIVAALGAV